MSRKRRISTRITDSTNFGGPPCPLNTTEPPTFRQVIQYGYYMENSHPTLNTFALSKLMANDIISIWNAVNPRLPLLTELWIVHKLQETCFKKVKQINRNVLSKYAKSFLLKKLDKLFDISSCSCDLPIANCSDKNVKCKKENCQTKHIVCSCPIKQKVPLEEREYLKDQRNKIGPKGNFQLGPVDKAAVRKSKKLTVSGEKKVVTSSPIPSTSYDDQSTIPTSENSDETDENFEQEQDCRIYNLVKHPCFAFELIRRDLSSNAGASLANALFLDLQAAGLLKPNIELKNIFLDKSKIDREKKRTKNNAYKKHNKKIKNLVCIGVDGKHDKDTLFYEETVDENGKKDRRKSKRQEHHLTFTKEMGCGSNGEYLTHRVVPTVGATGVVLANEVHSVLQQYESVETLKAVLLDNTSTNTGCKSGLVSSLEDKLERKLHTIGCSLHQNELPFRAVFKFIDGNARSPTSFTGPIGKLCATNFHHLPQVDFLSVSSPLENSYSILTKNNLTGDQRLLLEYAVGISRGKVDEKYAAWRIGPLNQARWLTLAIRLMCIWTRKMYTSELTTKMHNLIRFIVQVYAVCWFEIKLDNKFHNQQLYVFKMIQQIKKQCPDIQDIALRNIKFNAFALLPENILFSMLKSDELEVREEAMKRILTIRSGEPVKKRLKKIATINFNALHWSHLIDLSQSGVSEPALTEEISDSELRELLMTGRKPDLPDFPAHSQSVERAVKLTSEACQSVYGLEARNRHIIAKVLCREMRPFFSSKGSYRENFAIMDQQ